MLRKLIVGLALAAAAALPLAGTAEAAIGDGIAASQIASQLLPVEKAQFLFGGRQYCWYDDGWRGPGWYWCGYAQRSGFGWGGGFGWHGWRGGHRGGHGGPNSGFVVVPGLTGGVDGAETLLDRRTHQLLGTHLFPGGTVNNPGAAHAFACAHKGAVRHLPLHQPPLAAPTA